MCHIVPFNLPCCRRTYVAVTRTRDCPPTWPAIKCPKELCFQIGSSPEERNEGECWRCTAARQGVSVEEREARRPGIDKALVERFIDTPEMKRHAQEEMGFCWFCGCKTGCPTCEVYVDPEIEKVLGRNNPWDEEYQEDAGEKDDDEDFVRPKKRSRTTKARAKRTERAVGVLGQTRTRAKTRPQARGKQALASAKANSLSIFQSQDYLATPSKTSMTAGSHDGSKLSQQSYMRAYQQNMHFSPHTNTQGHKDRDHVRYHTATQHSPTGYGDQPYMIPPVESSHNHALRGHNAQHHEFVHTPTSGNKWTSQIDPELLGDYTSNTPPTPDVNHTQSWTPVYDHRSGESLRCSDGLPPFDCQNNDEHTWPGQVTDSTTTLESFFHDAGASNRPYSTHKEADRSPTSPETAR